MAGALEGVKVLDCTQIIAGPLAGALLSEMGADVVKVEPLEGEPWRLQAEIIPKESRGFLVQNRGKRGIALDLRHPSSDAIRRKLISWADVLLTNYRPGVPEALKLDYESARAIRPDIIYCEGTAFGKNGPDAHLRGYDIVAQAMSGLATSNPHIRDGLPVWVGFAPADVLTGTAMAWAITAALYHREKTGEGQAINASLLATALCLQAGAREITALDTEPREQRLAQLQEMRARGASMSEIYEARRAAAVELAGNVYYRAYQTADSYLVVGCLGPGPRARFREALAIHDPRYDPGFDQSRFREAGAALVAECEGKFRLKTNAEWLVHLHAHDVAAGPYRFVDELWDDPQIAANGYLTEYEHTLLGQLRGPAPIVQMEGTPTRVQRASPALGEHTDEVLGELGLDGEAIAALRAEGAVG